MGKIIAFSGRKQSGKNTSANFMASIELVSNGIVDNARIDEKGRLITDFDMGDKIEEAILDLTSRSPASISFYSQHIWPLIKFYSFADILKEICQEMFNVEDKYLWGTDLEKQGKISHILWNNMPGINYIPKNKVRGKLTELGFNLSEDWTLESPVSGRELLQYMGTEVFRCVYFNCHAESCLKRIYKENSALAVITDLRFENEIDEVHKYGGQVIRLTRNIFTDNHISETALNDANPKYDMVLDNHNMSVLEQCHALKALLDSIKFYDNNIL